MVVKCEHQISGRHIMADDIVRTQWQKSAEMSGIEASFQLTL